MNPAPTTYASAASPLAGRSQKPPSGAGLRYQSYVSRIERSSAVHPNHVRMLRTAIVRAERALSVNERRQCRPPPPPPCPITRTRALALAVPASPEWKELLGAMLDRAFELFEEARFAEADAILEFVPEHLVIDLLDSYFLDEPEPAK